MRHWLRADSGQTLLLTIGLTAVAALLVVVVVDVSRVFLADRSLAAAADSAATAGAGAIDEDAVYRDGLAAALSLDPVAVPREVAAYVELAGLERRFDGFEVVEASTDGTTVTVRFSARVELPFAALAGRRGAYPIEATARAQSTTAPVSASPLR